MKKRIISLLLVIVLAVTCFPTVPANAAAVTQESAVTTLLKWAKFTQADANTVGGRVELAYYIDIGGGAESYKLVELIPENVTAKIIAAGWMDLAKPEAGLYSHTAVYNGKSVVEEQTYTIYLNPTIYTVKEGHKLALVICTRDPKLSGYRNNATGYSVLISDAEAVIPVN